MKALIIDEPWISKILNGEKTWEMRSRHATHRGRIALVRKGSGMVVGVAELIGTEGPLDLSELREAAEKHRIPMARYESGELIKWDIAWKLTNTQCLKTPVPYRHPAGAVTWVNLSPGETVAVEAALSGIGAHIAAITEAALAPRSGEAGISTTMQRPAGSVFGLGTMLPVARDGTCFHPGLRRNGQFTIGEKGNEKRFDSFQQALDALRAMSVAKWRRPNDQGNWGIVSGIRWEPAGQLGVAA